MNVVPVIFLKHVSKFGLPLPYANVRRHREIILFIKLIKNKK